MNRMRVWMAAKENWHAVLINHRMWSSHGDWVISVLASDATRTMSRTSRPSTPSRVRMSSMCPRMMSWTRLSRRGLTRTSVQICHLSNSTRIDEVAEGRHRTIDRLRIRKERMRWLRVMTRIRDGLDECLPRSRTMRVLTWRSLMWAKAKIFKRRDKHQDQEEFLQLRIQICQIRNLKIHRLPNKIFIKKSTNGSR